MRKPRDQPLTIVTPPSAIPVAPPFDDAGGQELLAQACLAADRAGEVLGLLEKGLGCTVA
jgi:hypothetical protein